MASKGSFIVSVVALIAFSILVYLADLEVLPVYFMEQKLTLFYLLWLYTLLYFLRLFRNYTLFRHNDFTSVPILRFIPAAMTAGTIATYGPLKSGELVAMEIYQQHHGIDRADSLSVIVSGRIFDIIMVLLFTSAIVLTLPISSIENFLLLMVLMIAILAFAIVVLLSERTGLAVLELSRPLFRSKLYRLHTKLENLAHRYYDRLGSLLTLPNISIIAVFTVSRWLSELVFMYLLLSSFSVSMHLLQIISIVGLSNAIGVSSASPGALGTFQLTAATVLVLYGVDLSIASTALLVGATLSILINISLGSLGVIVSSILQYFPENEENQSSSF